MTPGERIAVWLFNEYSNYDEWDRAPVRTRAYYAELANRLVRECELNLEAGGA